MNSQAVRECQARRSTHLRHCRCQFRGFRCLPRVSRRVHRRSQLKPPRGTSVRLFVEKTLGPTGVFHLRVPNRVRSGTSTEPVHIVPRPAARCNLAPSPKSLRHFTASDRARLHLSSRTPLVNGNRHCHDHFLESTSARGPQQMSHQRLDRQLCPPQICLRSVVLESVSFISRRSFEDVCGLHRAHQVPVLPAPQPPQQRVPHCRRGDAALAKGASTKRGDSVPGSQDSITRVRNLQLTDSPVAAPFASSVASSPPMPAAHRPTQRESKKFCDTLRCAQCGSDPEAWTGSSDHGLMLHTVRKRGWSAVDSRMCGPASPARSCIL